MRSTHEIILSDEAERNIAEAFEWIAQADPTAAEAWYEGLTEALQSLSRGPERCPLAPETRLKLVDREVRQLLYGRDYWKYRILFVVERRRVVIAHVRHGARLYLYEAEAEDD